MEESALVGFTDKGSIHMEELVEQISELNKERISYRLCIYGLESRLNSGADELEIGEVIVSSLEVLKSHMVEVQGESSNFRGLVCV